MMLHFSITPNIRRNYPTPFPSVRASTPEVRSRLTSRSYTQLEDAFHDDPWGTGNAGHGGGHVESSVVYADVHHQPKVCCHVFSDNEHLIKLLSVFPIVGC